MKIRLVPYIKLFVVLAILIIFVIYKGEVFIRNIRSVMNELELSYFLLAACFFHMKYLALAFKFYAIVPDKKNKSWLSFAKAEYIIQFIDIIVPIPNIEDVLRGFFLKAQHETNKRAILLVFINRAIGLGAFCLLFLIGVYLGFHFYTNLIKQSLESISSGGVVLLIALIALIILAAVVYYFKDKISRLSFIDLSQQLSVFRVAVGFVFVAAHYIFWAASILFLLKALHHECTFLAVLIVLPVLVLSVVVPISYQGLGLPETGLFLYFLFMEFSAEQAFAVAFLHFFLYLMIIISGGVLFLKDNTFSFDKLKI